MASIHSLAKLEVILLQAQIRTLRTAYDEFKETGLLCVDTQIRLNTLGIDPEICEEEYKKHGE